MNLEEYKKAIKENGFLELPDVNYTSNLIFLDDFLNYQELDIEVKIHICEMLIVKCLPATTGLFLPRNLIWFIRQFNNDFKCDLYNEQNTTAIKKSIELIMSNDSLGCGLVGTVFMYRIIEYNSKVILGYTNSFGKIDKRKIRDSQFFEKLRKRRGGLAKSINLIDKLNKVHYSKLFGRNIPLKYRIVGRYIKRRNALMHGENENSTEGFYLISIYILMHFHKIKDDAK